MAKNKNHNNDKNASSDIDINNLTNQSLASEEVNLFASGDNSNENDSSKEIKTEVMTKAKKKKNAKDLLNKEEEASEAELKENENEKMAEKPLNKGKEHKKKKQKKPYEKTTFMHKMRVLGVLLVLGVFTGSGLGVWYFNVNLRSRVSYSDYDPTEYVFDTNKLLADKFNLTTKAERDSFKNYSGDIKPSDLKPEENLALAVHKATLADTFLFTGNGSSTASMMNITQSVYSLRRFDGTNYYFESISKGMLSIANLDHYVKGSNEVKIYKGTSISQKNANWNYSQTLTKNKYMDMTGSLPSGITPYIISAKTYNSVIVEYDEELDQYSFTFDLHPITSVLYYYKEMKRTGGLEADPEFKSIQYTAVMDSKWNLVYTEVFEEYDAIKLGLRNSLKGTIKIEYDFNCDVTPPTLKG